MNEFEIMSGGTQLIHIIKCNQLLCPFGNSMEIRDTGDSFKDVTRDAVAEHARSTGHEVEYIHGTIEAIVPLRTGSDLDQHKH